MSRNHLQRGFVGPASDFTLGAVYGLRQWSMLFAAGDLIGHRSGVWTLGDVNVAQCRARPEPFVHQLFDKRYLSQESDFLGLLNDLVDQVLADPRANPDHVVTLSVYAAQTGRRFYSTRVAVGELSTDVFSADIATFAAEWGRKAAAEGDPWLVRSTYRLTDVGQKHTTAHPDCTCGFYAYWGKRALLGNQQHQRLFVYGIVKGYGNVTEGTLGFRCEKAEIVALTSPYSTTVPYRPTSAYGLYGGGNMSSLTTTRVDDRQRAAFVQAVDGRAQVVDSLDDLIELKERMTESDTR